MSIYQKGDRVMVKPSMVDTFVEASARKIRDRVGIITGFSYPSQQPIVIFPKVGRRKEFKFGRAYDSWLIHAPVEEQP